VDEAIGRGLHADRRHAADPSHQCSLALVFAAIIIVLSYAIITLQFTVAMVESYIVVTAGFIFVGFGGSRWTVPYTERYIGLAVSTGVKIMLLYLLIGAGLNFAVDWQTAATTAPVSRMSGRQAASLQRPRGSSPLFRSAPVWPARELQTQIPHVLSRRPPAERQRDAHF
jgi:TrbL/VirB6 plasmid conjugal transfer protein